MKKWKKLLACLLASLMALAVFTACDGSAGVPIGPKHSDANSAKALCEQLGMTYSEELSDKALQHCQLGLCHLGVLLCQYK